MRRRSVEEALKKEASAGMEASWESVCPARMPQTHEALALIPSALDL